MFKVLPVPYCSVDMRRGPIFGLWTFCLGGVVHSICISPVSFACLHESGGFVSRCGFVALISIRLMRYDDRCYLHWFILGFPWLQGLLRSCLGLGMSNLLLFGCTGRTLEEIRHYFRCEYVMYIYNYIQLYIYNIHIYIYTYIYIYIQVWHPPPSNSCGHCYWEGSTPSNV